MKLITKQTDYALQALISIGRSSPHVVSSADLYKTLRLPRTILRKVLQILTQEGVLRSTQGIRGGFQLAKKPQEIFLLDLIRIFEGNISFVHCLFRKKICSHRATCPIRKRIKAVEIMVLNQLKTVTLKQLMEDMKA